MDCFSAVSESAPAVFVRLSVYSSRNFWVDSLTVSLYFVMPSCRPLKISLSPLLMVPKLFTYSSDILPLSFTSSVRRLRLSSPACCPLLIFSSKSFCPACSALIAVIMLLVALVRLAVPAASPDSALTS